MLGVKADYLDCIILRVVLVQSSACQHVVKALLFCKAGATTGSEGRCAG